MDDKELDVVYGGDKNHKDAVGESTSTNKEADRPSLPLNHSTSFNLQGFVSQGGSAAEMQLPAFQSDVFPLPSRLVPSSPELLTSDSPIITSRNGGVIQSTSNLSLSAMSNSLGVDALSPEASTVITNSISRSASESSFLTDADFCVEAAATSNVVRDCFWSNCSTNSLHCQFLLCSICKQRSPAFYNIPRMFSLWELGAATDGFSQSNFLAEGGFGSVYKGFINGQAIAVKQYKNVSTQGFKEFHAEIQLLSRAQHRNLVTLLGCCDEDDRYMLVYEYVCNKSLDWHLSSKSPECLEWHARLKIAIGAARALRYLHEDCRTGCIVHRDMRPNNILLTHDFEPMVGDFGLARSHSQEDEGIETRIIGAFGYLAPEYAESGQVSWRSDVYAFGIVLLELITGRKAIDLLRVPEQKSLIEWARPRLVNGAPLQDLVDCRLGNSYVERQMRAMVRAAYRCTQRDPLRRPRMSHVLYILEGNKKDLDGVDTLTRQVTSLQTGIPSIKPKRTTLGKQMKLFYKDMS